MKSIFLLVIISIGLIASGCSNSGNNSQTSQEQPKQKEVVIFNDMENAGAIIPSWNNEKTVVSMSAPAKAHSGEFVSKVDENEIYSYSYAELFKNINNVVPKKVIVNGWVNCAEYNEGLIIAMDVNENNKSVIWKGNPITSQINTQNEWHEFTTEFLIDQAVTPDYQIKIFAFGARKTAYFDDIKITFEY